MGQGVPVPANEQERLAAVYALNILDTPPEERFDRITRMARLIFHTPIALISVIDTSRQWFKSCTGITIPEVPREQSFCAYTLLDNVPLIVSNALKDSRFTKNPFVTGELRVRFYAGHPIRDPNGYTLGTLCILDRIPRSFSPRERAILAELAHQVERELILNGPPESALPGERLFSRFHTVFDDAAIGIVLLNEDLRLIAWNKTYERLLGVSTEFLHHASLIDLVEPDGQERVVEQLRTLFRQEVPGIHCEYRYRRMDGIERDFQVTLSLTSDAFTGQKVAIGLIEDITDRKETEQREKQATLDALTYAHSLEALQKCQKNFISVVSHEFRTTLTGIRGFSDILKNEEFTPAEVREFANDIYQDALRLLRLINDLLDLERMNEGRTQLRLETFNIGDLLRKQLHRYELITTRHTFRLIHDEQLPLIEGDQDKLSQVITNLLSNAVKYSPQCGTITLRCHHEAGALHIEVEDQGIGIPAEDIEHIFDVYSRVESEETRYIQGTGLGLAIVKQIIQMHNGTIWVESQETQGTTFHIILPVKQTLEATS